MTKANRSHNFKFQQKTSPQSYKTQINILRFPGLAHRALNNPSKELRFSAGLNLYIKSTWRLVSFVIFLQYPPSNYSNSLPLYFFYRAFPQFPLLLFLQSSGPECEYPNDLCQRCGFKRPAVSATRPLSVAPDIFFKDSRLDQLRGIAFSSAYAKQWDSLKKEFSAFLSYLPGSKNAFFPLLLKMFADLSLGKIPERKRRSMLPLVFT